VLDAKDATGAEVVMAETAETVAEPQRGEARLKSWRASLSCIRSL